jgi:hypothetical protein
MISADHLVLSYEITLVYSRRILSLLLSGYRDFGNFVTEHITNCKQRSLSRENNSRPADKESIHREPQIFISLPVRSRH